MLGFLKVAGGYVFFAISLLLVLLYTWWRYLFMHVLPHNAARFTKEISKRAQAGDVILTRSEGAVVPGYWSHSALCIGEVSGVGQAVVEARGWGVKVAAIAHVMKTHYALLLRPRVEPAVRAQVAKDAWGLVGRGFDFNFAFKDHTRLSCSEVPFVLYEKHMPLKLHPWQSFIKDWDVFLPDDVLKSGYFDVVWFSPDLPAKARWFEEPHTTA